MRVGTAWFALGDFVSQNAVGADLDDEVTEPQQKGKKKKKKAKKQAAELDLDLDNDDAAVLTRFGSQATSAGSSETLKEEIKKQQTAVHDMKMAVIDEMEENESLVKSQSEISEQEIQRAVAAMAKTTAALKKKDTRGKRLTVLVENEEEFEEDDDD